MERILTVEQMQRADAYTINTLGISDEELILRAGRAVAEEIAKRYKGGRTLVCVGKGNNGRDGCVIANELSKKHGFTVCTLTVANGIFKAFDSKFDIIVDCIFGIGLNREVQGVFRTAIEKINASGAKVVACDIPSGLDGNTGKPLGVAVKADLTVAIQEYKLGHFLNDGLDYCGEVVAKDIGISVWEDECFNRLNTDDTKKYFLKRRRNTHKGSYGKVAIVGGSRSYSGSTMLSLSALSALKLGAGYSSLYIPNSLFEIYAGKFPECIIGTMPDEDGFIVYDETALERTLNNNVIAIGMGMGVSENVYKIIKYYLVNFEGKLIIDADGLNTISKFGVDVIKEKKCQVILTPHIAEFARLTNTDKKEIETDAIAQAKRFAKEYCVTLALKSATTVITDGDNTYVNTTGTTALAKAGSGDVLAGILAGIITRAQDLAEGTATACFILGRSAEIASKVHTDYATTASDVIASIGTAIGTL